MEDKKEKSKMAGGKVKLQPLGDRVLVRPIAPDEKQTGSGIIIPETVDKEKPEKGKVVAVGEGRFEDGKLVPVRVKVGETVVFSKYGYDEIKVEGEEFFIIKEDNILAVVK